MTALRCTAKLLKAMKAKPVAEPAHAQNRLGEWTANLIRVGRLQLVVAVSEPTRLAVVIDAAPYATVPQRLCEMLFAVLLELGIEPVQAGAEIGMMLPIQIAATGSRSVLSAVNQFAWQAECSIYTRHSRSAAQITRDLSTMFVMKPKHIGVPADRVREAFGLPPRDSRRHVAGQANFS